MTKEDYDIEVAKEYTTLQERIAELEHQLTHRNCLDCSNHSSKLRMRNLDLEKENEQIKNSDTLCKLIGEQKRKITDLEEKLANADYQLEGRDLEIKELEKENAELKEQISNVRECFISASSGDDFEMAESAREVMEVLDIPCYRHKDKREKSKLSKAKELLAKWVELFKPKGGNIPPTPIQVDTEQFLKDSEVEK